MATRKVNRQRRKNRSFRIIWDEYEELAPLAEQARLAVKSNSHRKFYPGRAA